MLLNMPVTDTDSKTMLHRDELNTKHWKTRNYGVQEFKSIAGIVSPSHHCAFAWLLLQKSNSKVNLPTKMRQH